MKMTNRWLVSLAAFSLLTAACSAEANRIEPRATDNTELLSPTHRASAETFAEQEPVGLDDDLSSSSDSEDGDPARDTPVAPSTWVEPINPERVLNRLGISDHWYASPAQARAGDPSARGCVHFGQLAAPNTADVWSRTWTHEEKFSLLTVHTYELSSEAEVAAFVAEAQSNTRWCSDTFAAGAEISDTDIVAASGLSDRDWAGFAVAIERENAGSVAQWHFLGQYGKHIFHVVLQPEGAEPTTDAISAVQGLLASMKQAMSIGELLPVPEYSTEENTELEAFLIKDYGSAWLAWNPESFECFATQFRTFERPNGAAEHVVGRWCVPDFLAEHWATLDQERRFGPRIENDDQRLCYYTVMMTTLRGSSFQEALRIEASGSPFSDDSEDLDIRTAAPETALRAAFDQTLLDECAMTADDGVRAGLSPHHPLDDSPERALFCAGWSEGLEYNRELAEIDKLVARYTALAERSNRLVPPAEIAEAWRVVGTYYAEKARVHDENRLTESEIHDDETFQAFEDQIEFDRHDHAVYEYLRINCGYEPR